MQPRQFCIRLLTFLLGLFPAAASDKGSLRSHQIKNLLENYDSRIPPNFDNNNSTRVEIDLFISSFDTISETTMDYGITVFLRQGWVDNRLAFGTLSNESKITLDSGFVSAIWKPDLFFTNEKKAHFHDVTVSNKYVRLYRNGSVYYSSRVSLTLACPMNLRKFPLDSQTCSAELESYAYTLNQLYFEWRDWAPVEIYKDLELPQFQLTGHTFSDCTKHYTTGNFTCLQVNFKLVRDIGFYMIQMYIPSGLIVILSWVSFWINIEAIPARISLGVLTVLTMTTQSSGSRSSMPRVSYVKAMDVWMATCLLFVFTALLEFAIVNVLCRKEVRRMVTLRKRQSEMLQTHNFKSEVDGEIKKTSPRQETFIRDPEGKHKARLVDKISRKLFPGTFALFNGVYWAVYILWQPE